MQLRLQAREGRRAIAEFVNMNPSLGQHGQKEIVHRGVDRTGEDSPSLELARSSSHKDQWQVNVRMLIGIAYSAALEDH